MHSDDRGPVSSRPLRTVLAVAAAAASLVFAVRLVAGSGVPYINDFVAYWATGRLLIEGGNPYDTGALLELQRAVGSRFVDAGVVRNPPWALPLLLPFALLPFAVGWYVWAVCQILLVGISAALLWRLFDGRARPAAAILLTFLFPPAVFVALGGQIGGLLLLALAGFTWAVERRRDLIAGLFLGILTLKPHLLLPFGVVVLLWTIRERSIKPLFGAAARLEKYGNAALSRRAFTLFLLLGIVIWTQQLVAGSGVIHAWVGFAVLLFWLAIRSRTAPAASGRSPGTQANYR